MSIPFQSIQGFAGAAGVGVLCLVALFFIVSVFADNLPAVVVLAVTSSTWGTVTTLPLLVVAYVFGLLAIALLDNSSRGSVARIAALREGPAAAKYIQLTQEAEILSGSVLAFVLLALAALLNIWPLRGWARTLLFTSCLCAVVAVGAWKMSRRKHEAAAAVAVEGARLPAVRPGE